MGMFDDIKYEANCPMCGDPITGRQTKDGPQVLATYTPEELHDDVTDDERGRRMFTFYTSCDTCDAWVEISVTTKWTNGPTVEVET